MPTVEELLAQARELGPGDRRRLIVLLQDLQMEGAEKNEKRPLPRGWTRDLWEETPEYRVGAAQAISVAAVQERLQKTSWLDRIFNQGECQ
ncbi:hypothetical protein Pan44_24640 [Caulifigura coniformis]|uniref:Uncharacterized protein n=1 Tax=Caulifigura coniformis TaxID=2527983 RepID=A0A517SE94_9PLAN|nr:hypothetical protein [Caulifigura coniformis]QDT54431.1 hypothetical protein Pan44_24640 [Caulifigura coniformis]